MVKCSGPHGSVSFSLATFDESYLERTDRDRVPSNRGVCRRAMSLAYSHETTSVCMHKALHTHAAYHTSGAALLLSVQEVVRRGAGFVSCRLSD